MHLCMLRNLISATIKVLLTYLRGALGQTFLILGLRHALPRVPGRGPCVFYAQPITVLVYWISHLLW